MKKKRCKFTLCSWIILGTIFMFLVGCTTEYPESCPSSTHVGLPDADKIARDNSLPFQFPLDLSPFNQEIPLSWFGRSNECTPDVVGGCYEYPERKFHAAEDYKFPAGTPVYAMADGRISFSGRAGGYGWLIIIDHPKANLYSLYGHLSPSRWKQESGTDVKRGDLVAYLGDPDENGGSKKSPLEPHLHFGIRAGQTADYPRGGEWRFNGGWLRLCPQDVGWLQPSLIITSQEIPARGYPQPKVDFLTRWGLEIFIICAYGIGGAFMLISGLKKKSKITMLLPGPFLILGGVFFLSNRLVSTYTLFGIGIVVTVCGIIVYILQLKQKEQG